MVPDLGNSCVKCIILTSVVPQTVEKMLRAFKPCKRANIPGLKPHLHLTSFGTTEVVP